MTPRAAWPTSCVAAIAALGVASCASEVNTLEGSLGEILDLGYQSVEVSLTEGAVIVGYWRPHGEGRDVVFKLVAWTETKALTAGQVLDLSPNPDDSPRASCSRAVADDPVRTLAPIKRGTLTLDEVPRIDGPASGTFRVTLGEGGEAGSGRTAFGTFWTDRVVPGN